MYLYFATAGPWWFSDYWAWRRDLCEEMSDVAPCKTPRLNTVYPCFDFPWRFAWACSKILNVLLYRCCFIVVEKLIEDRGNRFTLDFWPNSLSNNNYMRLTPVSGFSELVLCFPCYSRRVRIWKKLEWKIATKISASYHDALLFPDGVLVGDVSTDY